MIYPKSERPGGIASEECPEGERIEINLLLEGIFRLYGFDFRNYMFPSIRRRIWYRVRAEQLKTISALQDKVLHDASAMERLFNDFSIGVTEMFREPGFFGAFREKIVPVLRDYPVIRIWHAGCSTGEEAYSTAIVMFEEGLHKKTTIYATDINENFLMTARRGTFPLKKMQCYTKNYLASGGTKAFSEYYSTDNDYATFHKFLIENVVFAQHNLVTDCSFNEFHVIICRNVLIYFNSVLQERVQKLFYESLSTNGFLGLGNKEEIVSAKYSQFYDSVNPREKLFRRKV